MKNFKEIRYFLEISRTSVMGFHARQTRGSQHSAADREAADVADVGVESGLTCICIQPWACGAMTWSGHDPLRLLQLALLGARLLNSLKLDAAGQYRDRSVCAGPQAMCRLKLVVREGSRRRSDRAEAKCMPVEG